MRTTRWLYDRETERLKGDAQHRGLAIDPLGFWYFWDESGQGAHGPYDTVEQAHAALVRYAEAL